MHWQRPRDRFQTPETVSGRTEVGKAPVRGPCHTTAQGLPSRWVPERFPLDSEVVSEEVLSSSAAERVSRGFQGHRVTLERFPLDSEIVSEEVLSSSAAERISRGYQGHRVSPEPSLTEPRVVRGAARLPCAVMPARQRQQAITAQWLGGLSRGRRLTRRRGFETRWPRRVLPLLF